MATSEIVQMIRATGWSLRELSRRSGVSINTLRALSAGRSQHPQRRTRTRLAAAFRQHSERLTEMADVLDPPNT